jgi:hypothetical protein
MTPRMLRPATHVLVALVDLGQLVLVRDGLVEQQLAVAVQFSNAGMSARGLASP